MDDASARNLQLMIHNINSCDDIEMHADFMDEADFDQLIDLIPGDNEHQITPGFDNPSGNPTQKDDMFCIKLPCFEEDQIKELEEGHDGEQEDSSGTTNTRKSRTVRSRTLISERRRRGRMKEKLYALRSLVPNITKMDKASIIGDAVLYVQELQMQAKKLKTDIAGLEASLSGSYRCQGSIKNMKNIQISNKKNPISKKIMQMDVFQVEKREFYVRLSCNKGDGISVSLYRTLEFFTSFKIQSSKFTSDSDKLTLTFTLNVKETEKDMNLPTLKLWIMRALHNQGFEFLTCLSA